MCSTAACHGLSLGWTRRKGDAASARMGARSTSFWLTTNRTFTSPTCSSADSPCRRVLLQSGMPLHNVQHHPFRTRSMTSRRMVPVLGALLANSLLAQTKPLVAPKDYGKWETLAAATL